MTNLYRTTARTGLAAALAITVLAGCGGGSSGISAQAHRDFVAGCSNAGPTASMCDCVLTQLTTKQGYDNESKLKDLIRNRASYVTHVQTAAVACKGS